MAAPRGNGLDTHRLWEALYLGCVPIVQSGPLDALYKRVGALVVRSWTQVTSQRGFRVRSPGGDSAETRSDLPPPGHWKRDRERPAPAMDKRRESKRARGRCWGLGAAPARRIVGADARRRHRRDDSGRSRLLPAQDVDSRRRRAEQGPRTARLPQMHGGPMAPRAAPSRTPLLARAGIGPCELADKLRDGRRPDKIFSRATTGAPSRARSSTARRSGATGRPGGAAAHSGGPPDAPRARRHSMRPPARGGGPTPPPASPRQARPAAAPPSPWTLQLFHSQPLPPRRAPGAPRAQAGRRRVVDGPRSRGRRGRQKRTRWLLINNSGWQFRAGINALVASNFRPPPRTRTAGPSSVPSRPRKH